MGGDLGIGTEEVDPSLTLPHRAARGGGHRPPASREPPRWARLPGAQPRHPGRSPRGAMPACSRRPWSPSCPVARAARVCLTAAELSLLRASARVYTRACKCRTPRRLRETAANCGTPQEDPRALVQNRGARPFLRGDAVGRGGSRSLAPSRGAGRPGRASPTVGSCHLPFFPEQDPASVRRACDPLITLPRCRGAQVSQPAGVAENCVPRPGETRSQRSSALRLGFCLCSAPPAGQGAAPGRAPPAAPGGVPSGYFAFPCVRTTSGM